MGLNRPYDRPFFVIGGAVKTTGGSSQLVKGQLALTDSQNTTPNGVGIVSSTAGAPKHERRFSLRLGVNADQYNRSISNSSEGTPVFSLNQVKGLRASAPKTTEQQLDDIVVGYDGFDPAKSLNFRTGDSYFRFSVKVSGGGIEWRGASGECEILSVNVDIPRCDPFENCVDCDECADIDCRKITTELVEKLRDRAVSGGGVLSDYVDITPVFSCTEELDETPYQYYSIDVCDTGSDEALALISAQYDAPMTRIARVGATSTYQVLLPQADGSPDTYDQTLASIIKGCEDCPAGWSVAEGGHLYAFTLEDEDEGVDESATIEAFPNYVTGSVEKSGNDSGVGYYTALFSVELTSGQISTIVSNNPTITVSDLGEVSSICGNNKVTQIDWTAGEVCNATEEEYSIVLPDTVCGETRTAEINSAYPNLTVTVADSVNSEQEVTLTGTSGTSNLVINGDTYLVTFNTDLATTASDFVTTHAAAILTDHGLTVTSSGATLLFEGLTTDFSSIVSTNVTGDLDATVASSTVLPDRRGCQTRYITSVVSNIVCEKCDPMFEDYYVTEAPGAYEFKNWTKVSTTTFNNSDCLCGIKLVGKEFRLNAEEALRDQINFREEAVLVQASAGYPEEIREGIGRLPKGTEEVTRFSTFVPRTHLGGNLRNLENEGRAFNRELNYRGDYLARILTGTTTNIENQLKQYVQYTLVVEHDSFQGGFGNQANQANNYVFHVEVGRHKAVEDILNDIAANAGVDTVVALP